MKGGRGTQKLVVIGTLAACMPAAVVWFQANRPLDNFPLRAESEEKIHETVMKQGRAFIDRELQQDVNDTTTYADIKARWQVIRQQMLKAGATPREVDSVIESARDSVSTVSYGMPVKHWPIFAKRGSVKEVPVWVITIAWPKPSYVRADEADEDEPSWNSETMVIDPKKNYTVHMFGAIP